MFCDKLYYQDDDQIMITNVLSKIHYQYNDHEGFWGPLITGNVHRAHDHIHDLQRLR
jgi:hypothetical protein